MINALKHVVAINMLNLKEIKRHVKQLVETNKLGNKVLMIIIVQDQLNVQITNILFNQLINALHVNIQLLIKNIFKISIVLLIVMKNIHILRVKQIMYVLNHANHYKHSFLLME